MLKKCLAGLLMLSLLSPSLHADPVTEEEYINRRYYQNNKLELVAKKRQVGIERSYGYTDIDTYTYSYEAFTQSSTDISTQAMRRSEVKEITEWYIYKGRIRELSDIEFLELVGDQEMLDYVVEQEKGKAQRRGIGNILIGIGLITMIGGAAMSAGSTTVTAGALGTTLGFFLSAFNLSPQHYIQPDYAQEKIDEYNIALKKKLALPLDYD